LRLERRPSNRSEQAICYVCDDLFEPGANIAILQDQDVPLGFLCARCVAGPPVTAKRARRRAQKLLSLLPIEPKEDSAERSLRTMQLIYRRAQYWKALAKRLEQLAAWD